MTRPLLHGPLRRELADATYADLLRALTTVTAAIDAAYWSFTRTARGTLAPAELYVRRTWLREAARRAEVMA